MSGFSVFIGILIIIMFIIMVSVVIIGIYVYTKIKPVLDVANKTIDTVIDNVEDVKTFVISNALKGCDGINEARGEINVLGKNVNPLSLLPECNIPCRCDIINGKQRCTCDIV